MINTINNTNYAWADDNARQVIQRIRHVTRRRPGREERFDTWVCTTDIRGISQKEKVLIPCAGQSNWA